MQPMNSTRNSSSNSRRRSNDNRPRILASSCVSGRGIFSDTDKWEAVGFRFALAAILSTSLAVANLPHLIPPSLPYMIGIMGISLAQASPLFVSSVTMMIPLLLILFLFIFMITSALLAAATISDEVFLLTFTIWTIVTTTFYFGSHFETTSKLANILIALPCLLSLSMQDLVVNGFTIDLMTVLTTTATTATATATTPDNAIKVMSTLRESIPYLPILCDRFLNTSLFDCTISNLISNLPQEGQFEFIIPDGDDDNSITSSIFAGQLAFFDFSNRQITIPGGLWIIKGFWTWSGTENPLAFFRNFIIASCWGMLCLAVAILFPPSRTARDRLWQGLVPTALMETAQYLGMVRNRDQIDSDSPIDGVVDNQDNGSIEENGSSKKTKNNAEISKSLPSSREMITETDKVEEASIISPHERFRKIILAVTKLKNGDASKVATFEPRCFRAPTENLTPNLHNLLRDTQQSIIGAIMTTKYFYDNQVETDHSSNVHLNTLLDTMKKCSLALSKCDTNELPVDSKEDESMMDENEIEKNLSPTDSLLLSQTNELVSSTRTWIHSYNNPAPIDCGKTGWKNILSIYLAWILLPLVLLMDQFIVLFKTFSHRTSSGKRHVKILWASRLILGYVLLFTMSVYWAEYSNFAISSPDGNIGSVYKGWHLAAYAFVWQPTSEGTLAKGMGRLVGTCIGGFFAWLGSIVCAWSYEQDADLNPYAVVAWISITSIAVTWFCTEPGTESFNGVSKDTGFLATYFSMTLSLIMLELYGKFGTRDELVVNRILATATGCAMAIALNSLPPYFKGNDPAWLRASLKECQGALAQLLRDITTESQKDIVLSQEYQTDLTARTRNSLRTAIFALEDCQAFRRFEFFRPDPILTRVAEDTTVALSFLVHIVDIVTLMFRKHAELAQDFWNPKSKAFQKVQELLECDHYLKSNVSETSDQNEIRKKGNHHHQDHHPEEDDDDEMTSSTTPDKYTDLVLSSARSLDTLLVDCFTLLEKSMTAEEH